MSRIYYILVTETNFCFSLFKLKQRFFRALQRALFDTLHIETISYFQLFSNLNMFFAGVAKSRGKSQSAGQPRMALPGSFFFLYIFTKVSKFQWDMHRHRADHRCDIRMRLSVAVLRLARLAVGALVAVAVGQGHLAAVAVGVLVVVVVVVVGLGHAELAVGVLVGVVV